VGLALTVNGGKAELTAANVALGKDSIDLTAHIALPESVNDFPQSDVDASLGISAPDLPTLTAMLPQPFSGAITGGGPIHLHRGKVDADLALDVKQLTGGEIAVASARIQIKASKRLIPATESPLDELVSHIVAEVTALRMKDFTIDSAKLDLENRNELVTLNTLDVRREENAITAHGTYRVPRDFKDPAAAPIDAQFAILAPRLQSFGIVANGHPLSGHLEGQGTAKMANGKLDADFRLSGGDFRLAEFKTGPLSIAVRIAENRRVFPQAARVRPDRDHRKCEYSASILLSGGHNGRYPESIRPSAIAHRIQRQTNALRSPSPRLDWQR
jgi:hypothetical protein